MSIPIRLASSLFAAGLLLATVQQATADTSAAAPDAGKSAAPPNAFALTLKGGHYRLLDETQTAHRQEWEFDDTISRFRSIEGEGRLPFLGRRIAIGGEYLEFRTTVQRAGTSGGETYTERLTGGFVKAKYFLTSSPTFAPYAGVGVGSVNMPDDGGSGPIESGSRAAAFQGFAGLQWRTRHVGLRAEVLYLDAPDLKDHSSEELDMSGIALTLGVSFFFGR